MRKWRNWQTRTFEGRVVYTVRVQVPFSAPKKQVGISLPAFLLRKTLLKIVENSNGGVSHLNFDTKRMQSILLIWCI